MSNSPTPLDSEALTLCRELAGHTFPWGSNRALELALLKRQPGLARPQRPMHFYSQQPTRSDGAPGAAGPPNLIESLNGATQLISRTFESISGTDCDDKIRNRVE
jgi:hypothetical protein